MQYIFTHILFNSAEVGFSKVSNQANKKARKKGRMKEGWKEGTKMINVTRFQNKQQMIT